MYCFFFILVFFFFQCHAAPVVKSKSISHLLWCSCCMIVFGEQDTWLVRHRALRGEHAFKDLQQVRDETRCCGDAAGCQVIYNNM